MVRMLSLGIAPQGVAGCDEPPFPYIRAICKFKPRGMFFSMKSKAKRKNKELK